MKVEKKTVEKWLELRPHLKHRSLLYVATREYVEAVLGKDFTTEHVQLSVLAHRRLQELLPNDAKGVELEKEWRADEGMKSINEFAEDAVNKVVLINGVKYLIRK